jgi:predicted ATP-grasp superfamily ATP-dependent carboligase
VSWSPDSAPAVLIAAQSGRALAAAARRAGYAPLVADLFGDDDTRALASRTARLPGSIGRAPGRTALLRTLDRLSEGRQPVGLAYGSGFEAQPDLLDAVAGKYPLLGNGGEVVRRLADPQAFAALCQGCAVPHPALAMRAPKGTSEGEWLEKRAGGAGGTHVRPARPGRVRPPRYVQRRAEGGPISALFLADGRGHALVLGFSAQWAAPAPNQPYRYGGAARPARLNPAIAAEMEAAVHRLAAAAGLVGLNAADFLVRADSFDLLEINPRPGASLDVFADAEGRLFQWHVEACRDGRLPARPPRFRGAAANAVAYARRAVSVRKGFAWPDWAADRQRPGRPVPEEGPLCTALAEAESVEAARTLAMARVGAILAMAEGT